MSIQMIKTVDDFLGALKQGPYAWPGGYPLFFICKDGSTLSFNHVLTNKEDYAHWIAEGSHDAIVGVCVNWEDQDLFCDDSGVKIDAAYGE